MKNKARNKILSLLLTLVMALGIFAAPSMTAYAADIDIGTGGDLEAGANLTGTEVYFGKYGGSPIKWHVVATDSGGTATLWTTTSLGNMKYDSGANHNNWSGSSICNWLNGTTSGNFLHEAFSYAEQSAITQYGTEETGIYETIDISPKIVLPSVAEIGNDHSTGTWGMLCCL